MVASGSGLLGGSESLSESSATCSGDRDRALFADGDSLCLSVAGDRGRVSPCDALFVLLELSVLGVGCAAADGVGRVLVSNVAGTERLSNGLLPVAGGSVVGRVFGAIGGGGTSGAEVRGG